MRQMLLQNATAILLQNATEAYYELRQVFHYKMRQLLQNATLITICGSTNSKKLKMNITADVFFVRKGAFWLNKSTKKDNTKNKNINISSLK